VLAGRRCRSQKANRILQGAYLISALPLSGDLPKVERPCPMCGGAKLRVHFVYDTPPPLETAFPLAPGYQYRRELHRCDQCGHYLEWFEADLSALYSGEYVSSTYGGEDGLRRSFEKINSLPPERSDNAGRVDYVNTYTKAYWQANGENYQEYRLLDVGAGLGVFPYKMKLGGWDCLAMDMDPLLVRHHQQVAGIESIVGDVRYAEGIGEFDLITFNKVLEHINDPISVLVGIKKLLKPDGLVYIELPDGEGAEIEGKESEEYLLGHIHVFSFVSYAMLVAGAGMQLICCERLQEPSGKYTLRGFARIN
jgi:SAM-dependent methyltransferase